MARKDAENYIIELMSRLDNTKKNVEMYKKLFANMSDADFDKYMKNLEEGKEEIYFVNPPFSGYKPDLNKLIAILKGLGIKPMEKIIFEDESGYKFKPDIEYKILYLPGRRTSHHASKGLSLHKNLDTRNPITGQVTGKDSKTGAITLPEAYIFTGLGLTKTLDELENIRGGDVGASTAFIQTLETTGRVSSADIEPHRNGVRSTKTINAIFKGMHIDINIGD
jgi:hypothetical protein